MMVNATSSDTKIKHWLALCLACLLSACTPPQEAMPKVLHVSALPDQAPEKVRTQHELLIKHVCQAVAVICQWVPVASYEELLEKFGRREIDLVYFGGATFALANRRFGAQPIAIRDIDLRFTSVVVVPRGSAAQNLSALRSHSFLFGAAKSTSGHVMPRHFLTKELGNPEQFFSKISYSRGHDDTLRRVASGEFAAGAVNGSIAAQYLTQNKEPRLRVLWESPPYIDYVWATRAGLPERFVQKLREAFLEIKRIDPDMREALEREQAEGYLPVVTKDFDVMFEALKLQGLLND